MVQRLRRLHLDGWRGGAILKASGRPAPRRSFLLQPFAAHLGCHSLLYKGHPPGLRLFIG